MRNAVVAGSSVALLASEASERDDDDAEARKGLGSSCCGCSLLDEWL